jgi:hypothetical protein
VQAAKEFRFQVDEGGDWHVCTAAEAQTDGDIVWLDVERSPARCSLTVRAELPAEYYQSLGIRAEPLNGSPAVRIGGNRSPFDGELPCGTYRLWWTCQGGAAAVIDDQLQLSAGEHREITALAPVLDRWEARIRNQEVLAAPIVGLRLGDLWSVGGSMTGGIIPFLLPAQAQPGATAEIYLHAFKMNVPGRVTSVDVAGHTFLVEHDLTAADRVRILSRGLGSGPRRIWLMSQLVDYKVPAWLGSTAEVPMLPGSQRIGCLLEQIDRREQVTCWFTLRHGAGELTVEPRGHWITVRVEPDCVVRICLDGPPECDMPLTGVSFGLPAADQVRGPGESRVFVADGTRAVRVVRPQGTLTFPPDQAEIVVR